jgi:hypothetical protein
MAEASSMQRRFGIATVLLLTTTLMAACICGVRPDRESPAPDERAASGATVLVARESVTLRAERGALLESATAFHGQGRYYK